MNKIIPILKVLLFEFILSIILLLIIAFVMYKTGMGQGTAKILILGVYLVSTFLGGLIIGKAEKSKRLIWGAAAGILYLAVLLVASVIVNSGLTGENNIILSAACCILGGCLGGMTS